jgi:23S rRNA pseudouridine2605 synthase
MEERLQKILAQAGLGSRRACEELISEGRVLVNGRVATLGQKADARADTIVVDGTALARAERQRYVILHKPRGVVSSLDAQGRRDTVIDLVPFPERLYPVGRLDMDSEGLILLTNDGELTNRLTHPRYETEKEYRVLVRGTPDDERLATWRRGVVVEGQRTAPAQVFRQERVGSATWLKVIMHEGRKHEIRDIGLALGMPVQRLIRVRMGSVLLGALKPGEWRELTAAEVSGLRGEGKKRMAKEKKGRPVRRPTSAPKRSDAKVKRKIRAG